MGRPFKCPYCDSHETVSKGFRLTKTMGKRKLRRCKGCKRKFTPRNQLPITPKDEQLPQESADSQDDDTESAQIAGLLPRPPETK